MLFKFKLLSQKILKSFTNLEKIMFSLFEMFCLLFLEVRTALGKLKAQAELKRNNYDKGHETFLHSNQISMTPAFKVISCKFCLIKSNTQRHLLTKLYLSEDFVVELGI